ncbi:MAG: aminotransferase class I/II-fold pyridoxal phosphate-dependent enzyme, partial [Streptomycetaceae bacterium]|nr:aminotransferase class I/II-fold pyridoxal phosphate-dependent enzyme [Streptomycetaceae bacterium]
MPWTQAIRVREAGARSPPDSPGPVGGRKRKVSAEPGQDFGGTAVTHDNAGTTGPRLRDVLDSLPAYKPGRPAASGGGVPAYKLSSNENPYPPLPGVLEKVTAAAGAFNRYPDMFCAELHAELADHFGVPVAHVASGTGSVGVAQSLLQATSGPGDEVVYAWRSFEAYPIITQISGAASVQVPLRPDEGHDLDAMAAAVTDRTRLVFVCNPNNPTGTALRRA